MTKHFSLTIAAAEALENVAKRQRSRFVSDAIIAHAKKKNIFSNYNTAKIEPSTTSQNEVTKKAATAAGDGSTSNGEIVSNSELNEDDQIQFDKDF